MPTNDDIPADDATAVTRLAAARIPQEIVEVTRHLQRGGHEAVLVGGAVRDTLMGLPADDWDVASSATPSEVQVLFPRTIPTGIEHGTVTVLVRPRERGGKALPVEVTTFRGEGRYLDGRRPSSITFLRDLHEDLARRDFTINAFAWDPVGHRFSDPFGGLADLRARRIRAVGVARERFEEDGLRTMRAVRLCATRALTLEPETEAAIAPALPVLDKVSRERVLVELWKLLAAERPSLGLHPMATTGLWPHVLASVPSEALPQAIAAVDRLAPDPLLRLARLLWPRVLADPDGRDAVLDRFDALKPARADRQRLSALLSDAAVRLPAAASPAAMRRAVAALGREHLEDAIAVQELPASKATALREATRDAALTVRELAIGGKDLLAAGLPPGPAMGALLEALLERVLDEPALNDRERLLAIVTNG